VITVFSENVYEDGPKELGPRMPGVTAPRELITWVAVRAGEDGIDDLATHEPATPNGPPVVTGLRIVR
jgi:hypothetical protein